ncbi:MAG: CBS domain-containing protein [Pyrinomonadaceae bacterium]|nr:CBS domain-containing protein [Pyrinomonadaceae bacterium]MBP6211567.1 CBS domain-containing protein [Pyrinomonadaceae bacterium]
MGEHNISTDGDEEQRRSFTLAVLNDLQALEQMLDSGLFEENVLRIGAEQEMFLVDSAMRPAPLAIETINDARDGRLTTEIGKFNLEANLTPREFGGNCLRLMEDELNEIIGVVRGALKKYNAGVVLAGILPTIQQSDLTIDNMTPNPRYHEINRVVTELHGDNRVIQIKGLDELQLTLQDTYIEYCNTSFQIHLQVGISDFVRYYNWAQAISGPVLASAVNSPILLSHRLWHETRLAVFKQSTDTRSLTHKQRNQKPRVNFGDRWVENSILEVLREDAIRFRILLTQAIEENSLEMLEKGSIPQLAAWRLHNGTIWRWNRPCYGIMGDRPGLRIEARFLPAGPTVVDEMATAAFFLGLMMELPEEYGDIRAYMSFDDARNNFYNAGRYGLNGQIRGLDGQSRRVGRIILEELLPRARKGLARASIDEADSQRLLDIIEERVTQEKTGARWMLDSYAKMDKHAKPNVRLRTLTAAMKHHQETDNKPMHTWELAEIPPESDWIDSYKTVEQFMAVDLFTVREDDIVDLAASLMHWRHVRHVPVEDDAGHLIGMVSHRDLIELIATGKCSGNQPLVIRDIMKTVMVTVAPETPTLKALTIMREGNIGCLPVIRNGCLVGLITAHDFLTVSSKLFEERLSNLP